MALNVNLTKRVGTGSNRRFYPVVMAGNGRVKPDMVLIDGKETKVAGGSYHIEWRENGERRRENVGEDAAQAANRRFRKQMELQATDAGLEVVGNEPKIKRVLITDAIDDTIEEIKLNLKPKSISAYITATNYFKESLAAEKEEKLYMDQLVRRDMLIFNNFLRTKKDQAPRSVFNKFSLVMAFLKRHGKETIVGKDDWPNYVEETPEIYEQEDIDDLLANCSPEENLWWQFFLMTGMREQEVMYVEWRNVLPASVTIAMKWKQARNWQPKGYKEREIPVPQSLIDSLEAIRPKGDQKVLVFSTSSGHIRLNFLDRLKACAEEAHRDPVDFYLHKFRATFATWHLQNGVDIRTVQQWMGHTDLKSTIRYLRPARNKAMRDKIDSTFSERAVAN